MTTDRNDQKPTESGHSRFAKRGQSSEERMPEDDSAEQFGADDKASPAKVRPATKPGSDEVRSLAEREGKQAQDGQDYGSGGSYGYGGGFDHGGEQGQDEPFARQRGASEQEEFYESTGGFGHETDGYQKAGIGHPGKNEKRAPAAAAPATTDGAAASGHPAAPASSQDDARKGYSQDAGYAQSGGDPAPGGKKK